MQTYFAQLCGTVLGLIGSEPTVDDVGILVSRLVELFQKLREPSTKSVSGLFAELMLIHESARPTEVIQAWRNAADERFDFATGDVRFEVKASGTRTRTHHFSFEQCNPGRAVLGILASTFVERQGGGLSIQDLVTGIETRLDNNLDAALKLRGVVAATLGENAPQGLSIRFDEALARQSFAYFDLAAIPAIRAPLPPSVHRVHFAVDLSGTVPVETKELCVRFPELRDFCPASFR